MKFLKKNIWSICTWAFVFTLFACEAFAVEGGDLMGTAQSKARDVFASVKTITFICNCKSHIRTIIRMIILIIRKWSPYINNLNFIF